MAGYESQSDTGSPGVDDEPAVDRLDGFGRGLRASAATGCLRASVSYRSTLCSPAAWGAPTATGWYGSRAADRILAIPAAARASTAAGPISPARSVGAATASGRGGPECAAAADCGSATRCAGAVLRVGSGALGLGQPLGVGERPVGGASASERGMGGWPLGEAGRRMGVDRRRVEVRRKSEIRGPKAEVVRAREDARPPIQQAFVSPLREGLGRRRRRRVSDSFGRRLWPGRALRLRNGRLPGRRR